MLGYSRYLSPDNITYISESSPEMGSFFIILKLLLTYICYTCKLTIEFYKIIKENENGKRNNSQSFGRAKRNNC